MELAAARGITQPGGLTSQPQTSNYPAVFTACFLADHPGDWMFHCHITDHQETGMMGVIRIT